MKKILVATLIVVLVVVAHSCQKSSVSGNNNNNNNIPQPTAVGTPTGTKTSKFIPKSGGTIASADGNLEIDIPAGALSADDTITVQPITNNCPGGVGHAYRLGPDGLKFNQPVTLKFHYDDSVLKSTLPDFMLLAFQDTSGIWFVLDNVHNDTSQHIISGKTLHFSDWTYIEDVAINPVSSTLKTGEKIHLYIINTSVAELDLNVAGQKGYALLKGNKSTWAVNGVTNGNDQYGTITTNPDVSPLYDYVTYTAPSKAPPPDKNPVLVSAEFNQLFVVPDASGNSYAKVNKAILYAHIYIIDGGYHVELKFEADTLNESGTIWSWKDKGSFDVVLAGKGGSVKNINNSDAVIGLVSNNGNCNVTLGSSTLGPINIVDSSIVGINPIVKNITVIFNALDQKNYIKQPIWDFACPGGDNGQIGGGSGPPFPGYIQFNMVDSTQTVIVGSITMVVTPIK